MDKYPLFIDINSRLLPSFRGIYYICQKHKFDILRGCVVDRVLNITVQYVVRPDDELLTRIEKIRQALFSLVRFDTCAKQELLLFEMRARERETKLKNKAV